MDAVQTVHDTFVLERRYPVAPARVFTALADPARKRRWYAEGEHEVQAFETEFRIGGPERLSYRLVNGPFAGATVTSDGSHQDIVPDRRVVITATMAIEGRRISTAIATFELRPDGEGTHLVFTHQAAFFEGADGPQIRRMGWEALLDRMGEGMAYA